MSKQIVKNYAFVASARTITLSDFSATQPVLLERIALIVNTTTNKVLYNVADPTVASAAVSGNNIITLSALQGDDADANKIAIFYNSAQGDPIYDQLLTDPDLPATGNITTQNLVPAGAATAGSAVELNNLNGHNSLIIDVTGTYTGALSVQATLDGSKWQTLGGISILILTTGAYAATIASAAQLLYQVNIAGFKGVRVTGLAAMTGTASIVMRASKGISRATLAAQLPTGANTIGSTTTAITAATAISLTAAASTNATSSKTSAGNLLEISADNMTASIKYLKLYNKASAPTVGTDVPVLTVPIPANGSIQIPFGVVGKRFGTGIAFALTGAQAVADTTALAAGDVHVHGSYL